MRVLEWIQTACATLIIGFIFYVSWFDIVDWFGKGADRKSPGKVAPAKAETTPSR